MQAAEASRQIKKKITIQQESLRFGKTLELASKALKPHGASSSQSGPITASSHTASSSQQQQQQQRSSPSSVADDSASIISFAMPMSTSTPKMPSQPPTSKSESSATSPSMNYPVMSLIKAVSQRSDQPDQGHGQGHGYRGQSSSSEPAVLPVTVSETSSHKSQSDKHSRSGGKTEKPMSVDLTVQKKCARDAFFSSLSSPPTPTTTSSPIGSGPMLSVDSPTEGATRISPSGTSSGRSIPTLVRSMAITKPSFEMSTAVSASYPQIATQG